MNSRNFSRCPIQYMACCTLAAVSFICTPVALGFSGRIALTFDDAPTPDSALMTGTERAQKIVTALQNNHIKDAYFFVKADNINAQTEGRLKLYSSAGFHLANHSFSHPSANEVAVNDFLTDVYKAHLVLKDMANFVPYFRFPYLHYGKDVASIAHLQKNLVEMGYQDGFVTIDNADWYINSIIVKAAQEGKSINYKKASQLYVNVIWEAIVFFDKIAQKTYGKSPPHVLLLHENDSTALFLSDLIRHIRKNGGEIISPQEAYADPVYAPFPATLFHKQGRVAAVAETQGVAVQLLKHPAENTDYLDALFKKYKVIQ